VTTRHPARKRTGTPRVPRLRTAERPGRPSVNHGEPGRLLGLTGGIATGKSTAARFLAEAGLPVIDADVLARRVVEPGTSAFREIAAAFGEGVVLPDGHLDRAALGTRVFADREARDTLNAIVHPRVEKEARRELERIRAEDPDAIVVYDVPLLFEAGLTARFDAVIVVYASRDEQLRRLMARDRISEEEARSRIASQMDIEEKARRADFVLDNMGSVADLGSQVAELLERLRRRSQI
jgi:dephospho-CoA kinase